MTRFFSPSHDRGHDPPQLRPANHQVYAERVATFAQHFHTSTERLGPEHIRGYLLHLIQERHVSWSSFPFFPGGGSGERTDDLVQTPSDHGTPFRVERQ